MSHHGESPFNKQQALLIEMMKDAREIKDPEAAKRKITRALLDTTGFIGATGLHPQGKLTPTDEGGIQFRVGSEGDKVVLDFGTPGHWVGMTAQEAAELASSLMKWARIVGRKNGETITMDLNVP